MENKQTFTRFGILTASLLFIVFAITVQPAQVQAQDADGVYTVVDEMPEIIGGLSALYKEIEYPREAIRRGVEGRVFIQFIVDEQGNAVNPEIMRDIGAGCGEAAIRAIKNVRFTPGKQNGEVVKVRFSLPVTFQIQN